MNARAVAVAHATRRVSTEGALTAWAVLALLLVLTTIMLGGCA